VFWATAVVVPTSPPTMIWWSAPSRYRTKKPVFERSNVVTPSGFGERLKAVSEPTTSSKPEPVIAASL
jgi:hypothetical protein